MYATGPSLVRWRLDRRAATAHAEVLDVERSTRRRRQTGGSQVPRNVSSGLSALARAHKHDLFTRGHRSHDFGDGRTPGELVFVADPDRGQHRGRRLAPRVCSRPRRRSDRVRRARRRGHRAARHRNGEHPTTRPRPAPVARGSRPRGRTCTHADVTLAVVVPRSSPGAAPSDMHGQMHAAEPHVSHSSSRDARQSPLVTHFVSGPDGRRR